METNKPNSSERRDPSEKVVLVEIFLQKTNKQCDKTCNYMESTGKEVDLKSHGHKKESKTALF
jgi:hypothetical protein